MQATIEKWGNSQAIRLPKSILENAKFKENESVQVFSQGETIVIQKYALTRHKTIAERLKNYSGEYVFEEWDTGESVGSEKYWINHAKPVVTYATTGVFFTF